jgi:hypothetical protein
MSITMVVISDRANTYPAKSRNACDTLRPKVIAIVITAIEAGAKRPRLFRKLYFLVSDCE